MSADMKTRSQRWRDRRSSFVGTKAVINPEKYSVDVIHCYRQAKPFVADHHYSGSFPATRLSCGLFRNGVAGAPTLVGVASFSVSMNARAGVKHTGYSGSESVELGRLVLLDDVEGNGESWFMARAFKLLQQEKPEIQAVYAYSDPIMRRDKDGKVIMPGHVGEVYQALNAQCRGRATARTLLMTPGAEVMSERALSKLRNGETGAKYAHRQLIEAGARPPKINEDPHQWIEALKDEGFLRARRHPGNWIYAFALNKRAKKHASGLPVVNPPKRMTGLPAGDVSALDIFRNIGD